MSNVNAAAETPMPCPVCGGPCVQKQGQYADEFMYESTTDALVAEVERLQERERCGQTPLMADVMAEREQLRAERDAAQALGQSFRDDWETLRVEKQQLEERLASWVRLSESESVAASKATMREQRLQGALREGLAAMYPTYPLAVAELCDLWLDRSGKLLGEIHVLAGLPTDLPKDENPAA